MGVQVEFRSRRLREEFKRTLSPNQELFLGTQGDVNLSGDGVRARHARLFAGAAGLQIEPLEDAPISINGKPISGPAGVVDGDWLALGSSFVQLRITAETTGVNLSERIECSPSDSRILSIGRLPQCDLTIPSPLVSRQHAQLLCGSGKVVVQDLKNSKEEVINVRRLSREKG